MAKKAGKKGLGRLKNAVMGEMMPGMPMKGKGKAPKMAQAERKKGR